MRPPSCPGLGASPFSWAWRFPRLSRLLQAPVGIMYFQLSSLDLTQSIFSSEFTSSDCVILFPAYTSNNVGKKVQLLQTHRRGKSQKVEDTRQPCLSTMQSYYTALGLLLECILSVCHVSPCRQPYFSVAESPRFVSCTRICNLRVASLQFLFHQRNHNDHLWTNNCALLWECIKQWLPSLQPQ